MPDPAWTLIAVAVGGSIPIAGKIVSDWLLSKWSADKEKSDRRREHLYAIQELMHPVSAATWRYVRLARDDAATTEVLFHARMDATDQMFQLSTLVTRIGDEDLETVTAVFNSASADVMDAARDGLDVESAFQQAGDAIGEMSDRIKELLW